MVSLSFTLYSETLLDKRKGYVTKLKKKEKLEEVVEIPPKDIFEIVKYETELGEMSAYLSLHDVEKGEKRPAIIWLTGGLPVASPDAYLWEEADYDNEQSARVFRHSGIVTMFPTLRGRKKGNAGYVEQFYGEVNDVISAAKYLQKLDYVDPKRIYLGGHSSGGTLALVVAESTDLFAGVISLGPTNDHYGQENAPYEWTEKEIYLRSPINFISLITTPTYLIEGSSGNVMSLDQLAIKARKVGNENVHTAKVKGASHFTCIHPVNRIFAKAILASKDGSLAINMEEDIEPSVIKYKKMVQEAEDLRILRSLRFEEVELNSFKELESSFYSWRKDILNKFVNSLKSDFSFNAEKISTLKDQDGKTYFGVRVFKKVDFGSLREIFKTSSELRLRSEAFNLYYEYWSIKSD